MLDERLLDKNRKYLVGVSGGVDSMALLDMLVKKAYNVIVVHYNYHFREDSDLDENLVRSYCQNHHLPFYVRQGDKKEYIGIKRGGYVPFYFDYYGSCMLELLKNKA